MVDTENDSPPTRGSNGRFLAGNPSTGRQPGATNRIGRDLRDAIRGSAERHGRDGRGEGGLAGFFDHLVHARPKEFVQCVAKLVPNADEGEAETVSGITAIEVLAVPANHYFTSDPTELCRPDPWLYTATEIAQIQGIRRIAQERASKAARDEAEAAGKVVPIRRRGGDAV